MRSLIVPALSGLLFALGLALAGMTDPATVQGFLDVTGAWDPSLAFVMAGALAVYGMARIFILRRLAPLGGGTFPVFPRVRPDARLLAGAALFGIGWGISGWCPGPAFVSIAGGSGTLLLFVGGMVAGMGIFQAWEHRRFARTGVVEPACPT